MLHSTLRLQIVDYFDSLVNEIDLFTETRILEGKTPEEWLNTRREEQIQAIRQIEKASLTRLDSIETKDDKDWKKQVYVKYCFTIEYGGVMYLSVASRYVGLEQIELLKTRLSRGALCYPYLEEFFTVFPKIFGRVNLDVAFDAEELFVNLSPIVEVDSWLEQCNLFNRIYLRPGHEMGQIKLIDDIRTQELVIRPNEIRQNDADYWKKLFEYLMSVSPGQIERSTLIAEYKTASSELFSHMKSLQENERFKQVVQFEDYDRQNSLLSDIQPYDFGIKVQVNYFKVTNWKYISHMSLKIFAGVLENVDLTSLCSLEHLELTLHRCDYEPKKCHLSPTTFRGMSNLEELLIYDDNGIGYVVDDEPFADLKQLKKLHVPCELFISCCLIDLPMLETLSTSRSYLDSESTISVPVCKLPSLTHFCLSGYYNTKSQIFLSKMSSILSYVKQLTISDLHLREVQKGILKEFRCLEKLRLDLVQPSWIDNHRYCLDNKIFDGLDHLTELTIKMPDHTMHHDALRNLVNLKTVAFIYPSSPPFDLEDKSIFDGLYSLKRIRHLTRLADFIETFTYFENLNRHVLVLNEFFTS